jgi:hypothetical protein
VTIDQLTRSTDSQSVKRGSLCHDALVSEPIWLISGTPGAGKTTVARALARRYPKAIAIEVDALREWVVSGYASPLDPWTPETQVQFALAHKSAGTMARLYAEAGFTVVIDGVTTEADVGVYGLLIPPRKVLLRPSLDVALRRNATRDTKTFDTSVLEPVTRRLFTDLPVACPTERGWRVVDSSVATAEETVTALISARWD